MYDEHFGGVQAAVLRASAPDLPALQPHAAPVPMPAARYTKIRAALQKSNKRFLAPS